METEIQELEGDLAGKEKEARDIDAEYRAEDAHYRFGYDGFYVNAAIGDHETRLRILKEDHGHLLEDIRLLNNEIADLKAKLADAESANVRVEGDIANCDTQSKTLYESNIAMTQQLDEAEAREIAAQAQAREDALRAEAIAREEAIRAETIARENAYRIEIENRELAARAEARERESAIRYEIEAREAEARAEARERAAREEAIELAERERASREMAIREESLARERASREMAIREESLARERASREIAIREEAAARAEYDRQLDHDRYRARTLTWRNFYDDYLSVAPHRYYA